MTAVRQLKRRAAKRPAPRTVTITLSGDYEGWECTARADFPARVLEDFQSASMTRIMAAMDAVIIDHNFPDSTDEIAQSMSDVDPVGGVTAAADAIWTAIGALPSR